MLPGPCTANEDPSHACLWRRRERRQGGRCHHKRNPEGGESLSSPLQFTRGHRDHRESRPTAAFAQARRGTRCVGRTDADRYCHYAHLVEEAGTPSGWATVQITTVLSGGTRRPPGSTARRLLPRRTVIRCAGLPVPLDRHNHTHLPVTPALGSPGSLFSPLTRTHLGPLPSPPANRHAATCPTTRLRACPCPTAASPNSTAPGNPNTATTAKFYPGRTSPPPPTTHSTVCHGLPH